MSSFIPKLLTNAVLQKHGGRFVGRVVQVNAETVHNKWKCQKEDVPVLVFEDGHRWIPNIGARTTLVAAWGPETDDWLGRPLEVVLQGTEKVVNTDPDDGCVG